MLMFIRPVFEPPNQDLEITAKVLLKASRKLIEV
jgi:hypothetical protein